MQFLPRAAIQLVAAASLLVAIFGVGLSGRGIAALAPLCAAADYQHHATVVVTHMAGGPSPVRRCVGFDEDHISGSDLLNRSRLQWRSDAYQGQGTAVCQVDGEPQTPPSTSCLGSNNDPYWSLWTASSGGPWIYAQRAVTALAIRDGDAEGFRYQRPDGAGPPDAVGSICPAPAPPSSPTPNPRPSQPSTVGAPTAVAPPRATVASTPTGHSVAGDTAASVPALAPAGAASEPPQPITTSPLPEGAPAQRASHRAAIATTGSIQGLGRAAAAVAGLILVGALLAQVVLPRVRR